MDAPHPRTGTLRGCRAVSLSRPKRNEFRSTALYICLTAFLLCLGCDRLDMYDEPRYEPLEASDFFDDGQSARPRVEGTIARGQLRDDEPFHTGKSGRKLVSKIPAAAYRAVHDRDPRRFDLPFDETDARDLRRALLERGRQRFDIHCSVCHGRTGVGDGMVVQRGFRKPPSYHIDRLRAAPAGHFFDVVTHGFGAMPSFASRIDVEDRWAIVAYVRALQLSQDARIDDVPDDQLPVPADERPDRSGTRESSDRGSASTMGRTHSDLTRGLCVAPCRLVRQERKFGWLKRRSSLPRSMCLGSSPA
ncbi:MAG TPA: cytochrome c, partial [Pirellulales bacterium]|nr:cytochrome c [Pirellulales bacterium]